MGFYSSVRCDSVLGPVYIAEAQPRGAMGIQRILSFRFSRDEVAARGACLHFFDTTSHLESPSSCRWVPNVRGKIENPLVYAGLGSFILTPGNKARGATAGTSVERLARIQNLYLNASEKLNRSKRMIDAVCSILGLGRRVRNEAVITCKRMLRLQTAVDVMLPDIAGVCLFLSGRSDYHCRPITLREIASAMKRLGHRSSYRSMSRAFRTLQTELRFRLKARRSEDYAPFIVERLLQRGRIGGESLSRIDLAEYRILLLKHTFSLLRAMDNFVRGGRSPYALAASSVYVASKMIQREHGLRLVFTQKSVSSATGVDEFTIREQVGYIRRICGQSQGMGDRRAQD